MLINQLWLVVDLGCIVFAFTFLVSKSDYGVGTLAQKPSKLVVFVDLVGCAMSWWGWPVRVFLCLTWLRHFCQHSDCLDGSCCCTFQLVLSHRCSEIGLCSRQRSYLNLLAADARSLLWALAFGFLKVGCPIHWTNSLFGNCASFVLEIVGIMLMTLFAQKTFWQWLSLVLHVLLQLIRFLTESRGICISWATCALFGLEILVHQVG